MHAPRLNTGPFSSIAYSLGDIYRGAANDKKSYPERLLARGITGSMLAFATTQYLLAISKSGMVGFDTPENALKSAIFLGVSLPPVGFTLNWLNDYRKMGESIRQEQARSKFLDRTFD